MRYDQIKRQYLLIGTLLLAIGLIEAFQCPEHCACNTIVTHHNRHSYNHAKCTSLEGLRKLGKTSEIHSLDLSGLNLEKITNQLDKTTNISILDLSGNRLSEINCLSTKRIRVLNLSNNRITSGKLSKIPPYVKHLNLTHNEITVLPEEHFKHLVHLKSLELADNPLNCTFETLEVRNWLQERQVWTDKPIRCMAPQKFKGRSWLQVRQADVDETNGLDEPRMLPFADANDEENDLMMGDDPNAGVDETSEGGFESEPEEDDELDKEFIPVEKAMHVKREGSESAPNLNESDEATNISDNQEYEGSGDDDETVTVMPQASIHHVVTEEYEGSGDDVSDHSLPLIETDDVISNETSVEDDDEGSDEIVTVPVPTHLNLTEMAINGGETEAPLVHDTAEEEGATTELPVPVHEDVILPVKSVPVNAPADAEFIETAKGDDNASSSRSEPARIDNSEVHESQSTYILLGILGILLIALILYVAAKRSKTTVKNRRNNNDIESPAQEMLNMDKNNLGKPVQNPVEFIPLIPEKHAADKKNNLMNAQEPLLQKLSEAENEQSGDSGTGKDEPDLQVPSQQPNGNATPLQQNGVHKENGNAVDDNKQYQPISPKTSRYSPVSD